MFRNSILYHRLWYIKRRNTKRVRIYLRLAAIFIILTLLVSYANKKLLPYLVELSEFKAESIISAAVINTVDEIFSGNINYNDLVVLSRDKNGSITSIETNVVKLNRLTSMISRGIQEKLIQFSKDRISIPFGTLSGSAILAGIGPDLHVDIKPCGSVETDFRSEFTSEGINQTRHRIYITVRTKVSIVVPLFSKKSEVAASIPIAETVIVGSVPDIYIKTAE